jgi:multicomponent Na+:H+ antiporter subunit E
LRRTSLIVLLAVAWALWSGPYSLDPLIFAFGVFSVLIVVVLVGRMDRVVDGLWQEDRIPGIAFWLRSPRFLAFMFVKVAQSNLRVAHLILDPKLLDPRLIRTRASQESALGQVIYANSITVTPGTLTLDVRDSELLVHALDSVSAQSVESGEIDRAVCRLEGSA